MPIGKFKHIAPRPLLSTSDTIVVTQAVYRNETPRDVDEKAKVLRDEEMLFEGMHLPDEISVNVSVNV